MSQDPFISTERTGKSGAELRRCELHQIRGDESGAYRKKVLRVVEAIID